MIKGEGAAADRNALIRAHHVEADSRDVLCNLRRLQHHIEAEQKRESDTADDGIAKLAFEIEAVMREKK